VTATTAATLAAGSATVSGGETFLFWVLAAVSVLSSLGMLLSRKAVHSALFLATTMVCLAFLYMAQSAPFLGVVQIVVYTGAVMMLFLFVLMLVGVDASDSLVETIRGQRLAALLAGLGFGLLLAISLGRAVLDDVVGLEEANTAEGGNIQGLAKLIFGRDVFVFELTSALLITAAMGAMVLTHRVRLNARPTQQMLSEQRFRTPGALQTPMPTPGVYARHNAVDTPALLPDGSPSEESVPAPLHAAGTERTFRTADGRVIQAASAAAERALDPAADIKRTGTPVEPHLPSAPSSAESEDGDA
jgi:NADH-quinone oxidoreductase subunit J